MKALNRFYSSAVTRFMGLHIVVRMILAGFAAIVLSILPYYITADRDLAGRMAVLGIVLPGLFCIQWLFDHVEQRRQEREEAAYRDFRHGIGPNGEFDPPAHRHPERREKIRNEMRATLSQPVNYSLDTPTLLRRSLVVNPKHPLLNENVIHYRVLGGGIHRVSKRKSLKN